MVNVVDNSVQPLYHFCRRAGQLRGFILPPGLGDGGGQVAPVGGTDGWSVAVTSMKKDYLADTYFGMLLNGNGQTGRPARYSGWK